MSVVAGDLASRVHLRSSNEHPPSPGALPMEPEHYILRSSPTGLIIGIAENPDAMRRQVRAYLRLIGPTRRLEVTARKADGTKSVVAGVDLEAWANGERSWGAIQRTAGDG